MAKKRKSKAQRRRASKKRQLKKMAREAVKIAEDKELNKHHILWQARRWDEYEYGSLLRLHPYFIKEVPKHSLHVIIHSTIADIPVPDKHLLKKAYMALEHLEKMNKLDVENDSIEQRIQLLLNLWDFDDCPRTYLALKWQQELVYKYYYSK